MQAHHFGNDVFGTPSNNINNKPMVQTNNNVFNTKDPFGSVSGKPVPQVQKKESNINQLWGAGFNQPPQSTSGNSSVNKPTNNNNSNSFNFFNSFGSQPPSQPKGSQQ